MPTCMIVNQWSYPGGGGEQFLFDTIPVLREMGFDTFYWLCFAPFNGDFFAQTTMETTKTHTTICVGGGFSEKKLLVWLLEIRPDFVHHQGRYRLPLVRCCERLNIPVLTGIHFWTECIILGDKGNQAIEENLSSHRAHPDFNEVVNSSNACVYACSEFVSRVVSAVTGRNIPLVLYPTSPPSRVGIRHTQSKKYVTLINVHWLKGGKLLQELVDRCPDIPFLAVNTERQRTSTEPLYPVLRNKIVKNGGKYLNRVENAREIYEQTQVLLIPSLVDETFCKIGQEAILNKIPVITSGAGYLSTLFSKCGTILSADDVDAWEREVRKLVSNPEYAKAHSQRMEKVSKMFSFEQTSKDMQRIVDRQAFSRIGIYAPWADQGLGIQARVYAMALQDAGYSVSILSFSPYSGYGSCQKDPKEWEGFDVVFSNNTREGVTDDEVINFLSSRHIDKLIIPEICFFRVFEIARLAKKAGAKVFAVPNIEIVRKDELNKYGVFDGILCNNDICFNILAQYLDQRKLQRILFSPLVERWVSSTGSRQKSSEVRFLCLGGLNSVVRKKVEEVAKAFSQISSECPKAILDIRIQGGQRPEAIEKYVSDSIAVTAEHSPYSKVLESYQQSDIVVHVSSHEGLGIGFYEALSLGKPVVTLDTPPHNEVVEEGVSGWLVRGNKKRPMSDNSQALLPETLVNVDNLAKTLKRAYWEYTSDRSGWRRRTKKSYKKRFSTTMFRQNLIDAMIVVSQRE